jgi:hypothetical protein
MIKTAKTVSTIVEAGISVALVEVANTGEIFVTDNDDTSTSAVFGI